MAQNLGEITINGVLGIKCDVDPSTGIGLFAPIGSFATTIDGSGFYYKWGAANTEWETYTAILKLRGTVDLVFGSEENKTTTTILNSVITSSNVLSTSFINIANGNTSLDDFMLNGVSFSIENIVDETSFDLVATAINNASGTYRVKYYIQIEV